MQRVLLINEGRTPHYRVSVYSYLSDFLKKNQFRLTIVSNGVEQDNSQAIHYRHTEIPLGFFSLLKVLLNERPSVAIFWTSPHPHLFLVLIILKVVNIKVIHWGHRRPLPPLAIIKSLVYNLEHWVDDAIILYSEHMRKYVWRSFQKKTFVANNTLDLTSSRSVSHSKTDIKAKYGITTSKNIICMGRMQRRKRIDDLIQAFNILNIKDVGLILAGPDDEGALHNIDGPNIFKLGPVYGEDSLDLLSAADVYCIPGAIGLSIVDAFYCGLPVVTENVRHGPEIMYLKDGVNGFMVPEGDINELTIKLKMLLTDDALRNQFSRAAKNEIMTNGNIERMCEGFLSALQYVCK